MKLTHITRGALGLHADNSDELARCVRALRAAGYVVEDIEDDPDEPWHVATIRDVGNPNDIRTIRQLLAQTEAQERRTTR